MGRASFQRKFGIMSPRKMGSGYWGAISTCLYQKGMPVLVVSLEHTAHCHLLIWLHVLPASCMICWNAIGLRAEISSQLYLFLLWAWPLMGSETRRQWLFINEQMDGWRSKWRSKKNMDRDYNKGCCNKIPNYRRIQVAFRKIVHLFQEGCA